MIIQRYLQNKVTNRVPALKNFYYLAPQAPLKRNKTPNKDLITKRPFHLDPRNNFHYQNNLIPKYREQKTIINAIVFHFSQKKKL